MATATLKDLILAKAEELGFLSVTIAKAEHMESEARNLETWLNNGSHGTMSYMEDNFDLRVDPTKLVEGAKSVITLSYNYYTEKEQLDPTAPKISKYAYGRDYHKVIVKKLDLLLKFIKHEVGDINGRAFVDSGPILERDWAKRSGHGWIGKNTMLINPKLGSYFFLSEIILDVDLEPDPILRDHCGTCTKCIDACPTDAISENGFIMDGSKCISYLTIEMKEAIPEEYKGKMADYMYGCDICQQVCPWNRFSTPHNEPDFEPRKELLLRSKKEWTEITEEVFDKLFFGSPVQRTKFEGLKRNIDFLVE